MRDVTEREVSVAVEPRKRTSVLARAREWEAFIGRLPGVHTRADLAAHLGVTRARVTQALAPLATAPSLLAAMEEAEANGMVISESVWRRISCESEREAMALLTGLKAA